MRRLLPAALLLSSPLVLFSPPSATAQPVLGVVVEEGTGMPVMGAMVMLFTDGGERVDRMLTNVAGRFALDARAAGQHYLTVERIGYATRTTDRFTTGVEDLYLTIDVPIEPVALTGLDVESGRRCEVRPEEGRVTARVWDEVRKALTAEAWTREAALYRYTLERFSRALDRDGENVLADTTRITTNREAAFESARIERLAAEGFVQAEGDSATTYHAPDAGALISDVFLDTHCMGVRDSDDGRIGLTFEPIPERRVPDIAGVLWVDATTGELDRLEYGYRNLIRSSEIGDPGGEVSFVRLPNGAWIVRDWRIRMPRLELVLGVIRRYGYRDEGGVTRVVTDNRGRPVLDTEAGTIFGVVTDSLGTGPPGEAVFVDVPGTATGRIPDNDGSFLFSGLDAGRHVVRLQRPLLASWGLAAAEVAVEAEPGEVAYVRLRVPSVADVLASSCGAAPRPPGTAAVLGRLTTPQDAPAGEARVTVRWPAATAYGPTGPATPRSPSGEAGPAWQTGRDGHFATATTTTDARGLFLLCDVPPGLRLAVTIGRPGAEPSLHATIFVEPGVSAVVKRIVMSTLDYMM